MKKVITSICTFMLPFLLTGQLYNRVFTANDYRSNSEKAIVIKWAAEKVLYSRGFNVYRSEPGSDWKKLNSTPMMPIKPLPTTYRNLPNSYLTKYEMALEIPEADLHGSDILRAIITLDVLRSQELGELLGLVWYDQTAQDGIEYRYKVEAILASGTELIGETEAITLGTYVPLAEPTNIIVDRERKYVNLKWDINEEKSVATVVEKKVMGGDFIPMDTIPIYVTKSRDDSGNLVFPEVYLSDFEVEKGIEYAYRFASVDFFGQVGRFSKPIIAGMKGVSEPLAPIAPDLEVDDAKQQVILSWDYPESLDPIKGFVLLYRFDPEDEPKPIVPDTLLSEARQHTFTVSGTGDYLITVAAVDQWGNIAESVPVQAQVNDVTPPQVPAQIMVLLDSGIAKVSWTASPDDDTMGYLVYRFIGQSPKVSIDDLTILTPTFITDTYLNDTVGTVQNGKVYYAVKSIDKNFNRSAISELATASLPDLTPPVQPFIRVVNVEEESITIEFLPNVDDDLRHFVLQRSEEDGKIVEFTISPESTNYEDKDIKPGIAYTYAMMAEDITGNKSVWSNGYKVIAAGEDLSQLQGIMPSNITVKQVKNNVLLNWKQQFTANNLGVAIYKGTSRDELALASSMLRQALFEDSRIVPGATYYYQVRTYAANGAKHLSDIIEITIKKDKK